MSSMESLSEGHRAQLTRFAQYCKDKRDRCKKDRDGEFQDFKDDRLVDPSAVFNMPDVAGFLDEYHSSVHGHMSEELEKTANVAAVYLTELFAQAGAMGVELQLHDISLLEDQHRLGQASALAALQAAPPPVPKPRAALPTIDSQGTADLATLQELSDVKAANQQLTSRYQQMQSEMASLLSERSTLVAELDKVKDSFQHMKIRMSETAQDEETVARVNELDSHLQHSQAALDEKSTEAENLRREMQQRLADSSQFQDLKSLLRKKTEETKSLKSLLAQHGLEAPAPPPPPPGEGGCIELVADDD